jgi:ATP-binding cassette subfamily A (ABC1) protein 3
MAYFIMISIDKTKDAADVLVHIFRLFPPYNIGEALIAIAIAYFQTTLRHQHIYLYDWEVTGRNLIFMLVEAIGFFLAVLLTESSIFQWLFNSFLLLTGLSLGQQLPPPPSKPFDEDILAEKEEVISVIDELRLGHYSSKDVLIIDNLIKTYPGGIFGKPKYAVRGISLVCKAGERFGLLGINGAGKTTALGVLTKEIQQTAGEIYIGGKPLSDSLTQKMIGYAVLIALSFLLLSIVLDFS